MGYAQRAPVKPAIRRTFPITLPDLPGCISFLLMKDHA